MKSLPRYTTIKQERILKPFIRGNYLSVDLRKNGKRKTFQVHRLVAIMFIPNPENKSEVNHIDGNKLNNSVTNLEWNTTSENIKHAYQTGLSKLRKGKNSTLSKTVLQYDLQGNFIEEFEGIREIARQLNINPSSISACCRGKRKKTGGYIWKYKDTQ